MSLDHFQSQKRTIIKKGEQESRSSKVTEYKFPKESGIMVKEGPCCHCGIENTPLWRNGPVSKPVLCNACGSRWRTRGTLSDYVPKHAMSQSTQTSGLGSGLSAAGDVANTAGPSDTNFRNIPRRRRSELDKFVLSSIERFSKQLYDIAHEDPEVFLKKKVVGDVLIDQVDYMRSTQPETALGAMLLKSPKDPESVSSSSVKTSYASTSQGNDANGGDTSPENGGNGGEQGELSFT